MSIFGGGDGGQSQRDLARANAEAADIRRRAAEQRAAAALQAEAATAQIQLEQERELLADKAAAQQEKNMNVAEVELDIAPDDTIGYSAVEKRRKQFFNQGDGGISI